MTLASFIEAMPKVELHVHLEGAIAPLTLLQLAARHDVALPARSAEELAAWYHFADFAHFVEIYLIIRDCIRTPDDIEYLAREFLAGQAAQNIVHTEATYTPFTHWRQHRILFADQLAALNRARSWAGEVLGVTMSLTLDIAREVSPDEGLVTTEWAISGLGDGVTALGLAGSETAAPTAKFQLAFDRARTAGLHSVPHAGEIDGATSVWDALRDLRAERIGHGVRCLEDPSLVAELRATQIPLEVCPSSNVCLAVAPDWPGHPLPRLMAEGLYVTLNSDDPPLFSTSLTQEYQRAAATFGLDADELCRLSLAALRASFLPEAERRTLEARFATEFERLQREHDLNELHTS